MQLFRQLISYVKDIANCSHSHAFTLKRSFWWPRMRQFVEDFVSTCHTCFRAKLPRHHPYGLLEPLPIPSKLWQSIALDFITDLPIAKGFNAILTVVDRYMKMAHFLPCTKEISSEETTGIVMAFPIVSLATVDPSSYRNSGRTFLKC